MSIAYLGVGSNLGDRQKNIERAYGLLEEHRIRILKKSSLMETDPVGGPPQGLFLNGVVKVQTEYSPVVFLRVLKKIEKALGRLKTVHNGPRPIDLDILLYDDIKLETPVLTIPHPRMWQRAFVLDPLKEIAPEVLDRYESS